MQTLLTYQKPLAGAIILSSFLGLYELHLRNRDAIPKVNLNIPILMCHGHMDNVIPFKFAQDSAQRLQQLGFTNVRFLAYDDLAHGTNDEVRNRDVSVVYKRVYNRFILSDLNWSGLVV